MIGDQFQFDEYSGVTLITAEVGPNCVLATTHYQMYYTRVRLPSKPAPDLSIGQKLPVCAVCAIMLKKLHLYVDNNPLRAGTSPGIRFCFPVENVVLQNPKK